MIADLKFDLKFDRENHLYLGIKVAWTMHKHSYEWL